MTSWLKLKQVGVSTNSRGETCRQIHQDRRPTCKQLRHRRQRGIKPIGRRAIGILSILQARRLVIFGGSGVVNSTRRNKARTEFSMITIHQANTRSSSSRIAHLCVTKKKMSSTCDVSSFAAPDTDHQQKFTLTHSIHVSYLSDGVTFAHKPYDSRPIFTLRCSTAEWRINTNPISHRL